MPQFYTATYFSQIFWLLACFIAVLLFSWLVSLPRLTSLLKERWKQIEGQRLNAMALKREAEALKSTYEMEIDAAHQHAKKLLQHEEGLLRENFEQEKARLTRSMRKKIQTLERTLSTKVETLTTEMPYISQELSSKIINKILEIPPLKTRPKASQRKKEALDA